MPLPAFFLPLITYRKKFFSALGQTPPPPPPPHVRYFDPEFPLKKNPKLSWTAQLGPTGLAGETAFCGWKEHSKAKKGETVFVSSGAGGVGSIVVQLAKKEGLKVIASAGTDAKVKFLKEIGADVAFNYKTTDAREVLAKEGPLDIYRDNVGGETFSAAIEATKMNARLIVSAAKSQANFGGTNQPIKVSGLFNARSLTMVGFNMFFLRYKHMAAFHGEHVPQVANGEFKYAEDVRYGLANAGEALLHALSGDNVGKVSVIVAEESARCSSGGIKI
ncbi:hypothetical protein B0H16DRAFT_1891416 [Mycena metata]|uniref:Alcohol dehydrogenase-like C-terminal domain-containing protein n=1 Tax=Mycena metata TaxID=1033252 RepID=A0AAD7IBW5_9AGAR|nr:hypothetical protein B0H16DRAFT_1891416 [Mycena metata]